MATARKAAALSSLPTNNRVLRLELDVTSTSSIEAALQATLEKFGRIDVVVNNAGYTLAGDTESAGDEEARAVLDTNFWGTVDVTKRALGILRDENPKTGQQGGVILNVSSVGGYIGFPGQSFYHASKFAIEGWSESLAKELPAEWNSKSISLTANLDTFPSQPSQSLTLSKTQSISPTSSLVESRPTTQPPL